MFRRRCIRVAVVCVLGCRHLSLVHVVFSSMLLKHMHYHAYAVLADWYVTIISTTIFIMRYYELLFHQPKTSRSVKNWWKTTWRPPPHICFLVSRPLPRLECDLWTQMQHHSFLQQQFSPIVQQIWQLLTRSLSTSNLNLKTGTNSCQWPWRQTAHFIPKQRPFYQSFVDVLPLICYIYRKQATCTMDSLWLYSAPTLWASMILVFTSISYELNTFWSLDFF